MARKSALDQFQQYQDEVEKEERKRQAAADRKKQRLLKKVENEVLKLQITIGRYFCDVNSKGILWINEDESLKPLLQKIQQNLKIRTEKKLFEQYFNEYFPETQVDNSPQQSDIMNLEKQEA